MKRSSNWSVATRLRALLVTAGLVLAGVVGVASPASASPFDTALLSGSGWLGGDGVTVYSNGSPGYVSGDYSSPAVGMKWQCVELAQRLYTVRGWHLGVFSGVGVAADIYNVGAAPGNTNDFTRQANGSITSVVPGDMLVFSGGGGPGHVGIINTITDNGNGTKTLAVVNQNAYEVTSNVTWNTSAKTISKYWYMDGSSPETTFSVMGIVHDPDNTTNGGTPSTRSDIRNGGFNNGTYWTRTGTANFTTYGMGTYEGSGYGATNAAAAGDGIRQEVAINLTVGRSFCVSAQVRTTGAGSGASGSMAVYLLGSTATESSSKTFSGLGTDWMPIETCVTASSVHSTLRVQFYPAAGGATLGVDAVEIRESLLDSAGFNGSTSGWGVTGSANFANYSTGAYEGSGYVAVNASASGDSLKQDRTRSMSAGMTHCLEAQVRSNTAGVAASGSMAVYLLGSTATENSSKTFTAVGGDWTPIKTCVTAAGAHTSVRVQFYPAPGGATIGVDAVSFHATLAKNGGFNGDSAGWIRNGTANFALGTSGAYEGSGFGAVNAAAGNDSISATVTRTVVEGDMYCVSAHVRTNGSGTGASGTLTLWMLGATANENSEYTFTGLTSDWTPIKTCVTATGAHSSLKVQLYPMPGGPTVAVDAVDMG